MSLAWHISGDVSADLRLLETPFQEAVFDELERLASNPSRLAAPTEDWGSVHPFTFVHGGKLYALTLHLSHNQQQQVITLLGVRVFSVD